MASVVIQGDTSGSVTLQAPAVAGSTTVNLPSTIGNAGTSAVVTTDASGNAGIGVTPSAWVSSAKGIQFGPAGSLVSSTTANALMTSNAYYDGTNWRYINTNTATYYSQNDGVGRHAWFNAPSGTAGNAITFTQAMTLDASGNFYVGTTSQVGGSNITFYQPNNADLKIAGAVSTATRAVYQVFVNTAVTTVGTENSTGGSLASGTAAYATVLANNGAYPICFATNNTERGRFTSAGEFWVAGTTDQGAYNIQCNGTGVWGAGAYVNGSDARIKEEIAPIDSGLDVVQKLNPVTYKYKENWTKDRSTQTGFIAQELLVALEGKNYVDGVVTQGGSEGYYSVAYQNIIPILTKAIQELNAKVEAQAAEIAALKAAGSN